MVLRVLTIGDCPDRSQCPIFESNELSQEASRDISFMPKSPVIFQMCANRKATRLALRIMTALAYFWT